MLVGARKALPQLNARLLLILGAILFVSFGLASCGGGTSSSSPSTTPPTTQPPTNQPSSPPPPPTSSVTVSLSPGISTVTTSHPQTITATLTGGLGTMLWFVDDVQNGDPSVGTITISGSTTAVYSPSSSTTPGSHSIAAEV